MSGVGVDLAGLRMFRGGDPVLHDLFKLPGGDAGVRGHPFPSERVRRGTARISRPLSTEANGSDINEKLGRAEV